MQETHHQKHHHVLNGSRMLYEVSVRPWFLTLSQKYKKTIDRINEIPMEEFQHIKNMGFDMVWLMGVWSLGKYAVQYETTAEHLKQEFSHVLPGYTKDDVIGYPYAITKYEVNPQVGTLQDLQHLKKSLNNMGLHLMLDFVPNHTAVDSPLVNSNPDHYVRAPKDTKAPYDPNTYLPSGIACGASIWGHSWLDTAQINIWNTQAIRATIQELSSVAAVSDAVRVNMAHLVLNSLFNKKWGTQLASWGYKQPAHEFWDVAIKEVKKSHPHVVFMAEVYTGYEEELQNLGFDYTYDKSFRDIVGGGNIDQIRGWINSHSWKYNKQSVRFISNHDEQRGVAYFGSWWRSNAAALLTYTLPGMKMFWMGEFEGMRNQLEVHLRRQLPEPVNEATVQFYKVLTSVISKPAFKAGDFQMLTVTGTDSSWPLIAYKWTHQQDRVLCVVNFSNVTGSGRIILNDAEPHQGRDIVPVSELLTGVTYQRSAHEMKSEGLFVIVNSWSGQIFKY
ncbi:hypothetical protein SAMD00019534_111560 [Acytostelium subglobosum LB1]|uniref:hypothetical protein n=1 Tax=Acytostelium subglobosum LB1 TaxID=1410327 RepID=UPI000644A052|nr:hypothetical protein SAMD00019534_111560 [Acytostelium subglobosum LB1]GAM27980.1 hypothetical protein SAMD00019534_111560 [Acytostelium subglobosum LB1]|eukprot:XP_012748939.1 hypothetical protein SAMD00019534_111560 [Acytostelium subglobosum LB1]